MLEIFILSCMANVVFWYMAAVDWWYFTLLLALISLSKYDYDTYMTSSDIQRGIKDMRQTKCCNITYFQDPKLIKTSSRNMRVLTGILACLALVLTFFFKDDIESNIDFISTCWIVVSLSWLLSIIPQFISLLQCAASKTTPAIIKYRMLMSVYILHDVFLGVFWLYLSSMLYDLFDDVDDTEWRKIFLSMLWWHLLILCCLAVNRMPVKTTTQSCCGAGTMSYGQEFFLLVSIFCIYLVIIYRLRFDQLTDMKLPFSSLLVFEISLIVIYFCKKNQRLLAKENVKRSSAEFSQTDENYDKNVLFF